MPQFRHLSSSRIPSKFTTTDKTYHVRPVYYFFLRDAFLFQPGIEAIIIEKTIESGIEGMPSSGRQLACGDPEGDAVWVGCACR